MSRIGTQQECRHQVVHREATDAATKHMTEDAHLKIVCKTGSSTNKKQHAVGCQYLHTVVNSHQLTIKRIAGIRRDLCDQFIAVRNGKHPWWTKAFVRTVREIEHHDVGSPGIFAAEFPEKHAQEWTKQALITLEMAMAAYMVEVIAASQCLKQQLLSCRYSTCLQLWQGKEVVYSWNSPTCAWP